MHAETVAAASQRFDIAPGPLDSRLNQFARAARVTLSFTPAQVQGRISAGLRGSFATGQGLERLLAGTGLAGRATASGYVLEEARPVSSAAEPAQAGEPAAVRMDPVEVRAEFTGRRDQDQAYRQAGSSSYLSREDIERNRGSSVGDIFRGTTGVLIGENRNSGGLDVNIRGMQGQGRVPILVDGARQETTVYRGYSGVASRSYVDPDLIGGIQIDKGPTMSAQGTGATGGLVQMRTLIAEDVVQPGETFGLRLRGQAIGNNSGSPVAPGTPAGLFTGDFSGADPVYRTDCVAASICTPALPSEWGYAQGMDRPNTLDAKSWAGSLAVARRWERADLVAAYAHRNQGNYHAGTHGPTPYVDLSDVRQLPFYSEVRPVIRGASRLQGGERIPGTNYESSSGLLKGTLYLPQEQELELSLLRYRSTYSEIMPSQIVRFGNIAPVTQPRNSEVQADTASSRYRWNPGENALLDLRANLWYTRTQATNNSPSATEVNLYNNELERYKRWGVDVGNTSRLDHGGWGAASCCTASPCSARRWEPRRSPRMRAGSWGARASARK
ncbi:MAG: TonB-dependent receptor plug domain-containing protein [Pseudorhodoferax sp.]